MHGVHWLPKCLNATCELGSSSPLSWHLCIHSSYHRPTRIDIELLFRKKPSSRSSSFDRGGSRSTTLRSERVVRCRPNKRAFFETAKRPRTTVGVLPSRGTFRKIPASKVLQIPGIVRGAFRVVSSGDTGLVRCQSRKCLIA